MLKPLDTNLKQQDREVILQSHRAHSSFSAWWRPYSRHKTVWILAMTCYTRDTGQYQYWLWPATLKTQDSLNTGCDLLHSRHRTVWILAVTCYIQDTGQSEYWLWPATLKTQDSLNTGCDLLPKPTRLHASLSSTITNLSHAMAQVVRPWLPTAAVLLWSQVRSCGVNGGETGTLGLGECSPNTSVSPVNFCTFINHPMLSVDTVFIVK
jgi:hypothetical protein